MLMSKQENVCSLEIRLYPRPVANPLRGMVAQDDSDLPMLLLHFALLATQDEVRIVLVPCVIPVADEGRIQAAQPDRRPVHASKRVVPLKFLRLGFTTPILREVVVLMHRLQKHGPCNVNRHALVEKRINVLRCCLSDPSPEVPQ